MRASAVLSTLLAVTAAPALAQDAYVEFGSSPNPVGSGARALGIASAFIATADDATAASWNPGGLIALEKPEVSVVGSLKNRNERFGGPGIAAGQDVQRYTYPGLNYFSVAYPFRLGSRFFVAALNFQGLIDFDKRVARTFFSTGDGGLRAVSDTAFQQNGTIYAISPALAFQLSPGLALGLSLAISTSKLGFANGWTQKSRIARTVVVGPIEIAQTSAFDEEFAFDGLSATAGILWDLSAHWTLGAVVKSPMWGTVTHRVFNYVVTEAETGSAPTVDERAPARAAEALRFPLSYGLGVAFRYSDELTVSLDAYRTEWSLFRHAKTNLVTGAREVQNPIAARPGGKADVGATTQAHLGAERLFIFERTVVPLRGGVFYDPEPGDGRTNHFFGAALGTGVSLGDFILDVAYQFRFAVGTQNDVVRLDQNSDAATVGSKGGQVWQHLVYVSSIYHF